MRTVPLEITSRKMGTGVLVFTVTMRQCTMSECSPRWAFSAHPLQGGEYNTPLSAAEAPMWTTLTSVAAIGSKDKHINISWRQTKLTVAILLYVPIPSECTDCFMKAGSGDVSNCDQDDKRSSRQSALAGDHKQSSAETTFSQLPNYPPNH